METNLASQVTQVVKNLPANARDAVSIPRLGRSSGEGNSNPLLYSCLGNPMYEETGGLPSMGSQRIRHNWVTAHAWDYTIYKSDKNDELSRECLTECVNTAIFKIDNQQGPNVKNKWIKNLWRNC